MSATTHMLISVYKVFLREWANALLSIDMYCGDYMLCSTTAKYDTRDR